MLQCYSKHGDTKVKRDPLALIVKQGTGPMYSALVIGHCEAKAAIWKLETVVGSKRARSIVTEYLKKLSEQGGAHPSTTR